MLGQPLQDASRILAQRAEAPRRNEFRLHAQFRRDPADARSIRARVPVLAIERAGHDANEISVDVCGATQFLRSNEKARVAWLLQKLLVQQRCRELESF